MKKKNLYSIIITIITIILLIIVLILLFGKNSNNIITEEEALNIALQKANVTRDDATVLSTNKKRNKYEVEFHDSQYEYDVEVNMNTGEVIEFEKDVLDGNIIKNEESNKQITLDEAKTVALNHLNLTANDVTFTKNKLDLENGISIYELEFFTNDTEYEVDVNVYTQEIVRLSKDTINNQNNTNSSNYIGSERAKEIALNHTNSNSSVIWKKVEFELDNNLAIYELEFYINNVEYNYEIDAITGEIIQFEIDNN